MRKTAGKKKSIQRLYSIIKTLCEHLDNIHLKLASNKKFCFLKKLGNIFEYKIVCFKRLRVMEILIEISN